MQDATVSISILRGICPREGTSQRKSPVAEGGSTERTFESAWVLGCTCCFWKHGDSLLFIFFFFAVGVAVEPSFKSQSDGV